MNLEKKQIVLNIIKNGYMILERPVPLDILKAQVESVRYKDGSRITAEEFNEIMFELIRNKIITYIQSYQFPTKRDVMIL